MTGAPMHIRTSIHRHQWCARRVGVACRFAVAFLVVSSGAAAGQVDSVGSPEETRRTCAMAAAALKGGGDRAAFHAALARVQTCPDDGPVSLAALSDVSGRVRDRRVLAALSTAVSDVSLGASARLAAIAAVASQVDPGLVVTFVWGSGPNRGAYPRPQIARLTHSAASTGSQTVDKRASDQAIELLRRLGEADPDVAVQHSASAIFRYLSARAAS
jgi:hypothetical protein